MAEGVLLGAVYTNAENPGKTDQFTVLGAAANEVILGHDGNPRIRVAHATCASDGMRRRAQSRRRVISRSATR
jgi:hypothetical protein